MIVLAERPVEWQLHEMALETGRSFRQRSAGQPELVLERHVLDQHISPFAVHSVLTS